MGNILLHDFNKDQVGALIKGDMDYFQDDLADAKGNYKFIDLVFKNALNFVAHGFSTKSLSIHEQLKYLRVAQKSCISWIYLKSNSGVELKVDLDGSGEELTLKADKADNFSAGDWMQAWNLAVILREKGALEELYKTDISSVKPLNEKDHIRIGYLNFQYFHSLGAGSQLDMNLHKEMDVIVETNLKGYYMPDVAEFPYTNYFISFNRALILKAIVEGNQEEFTKHLFEGLTYHKTFWGQKKGLNKGDAPLCDDPQGFISWHLTALAAMAYDKGMKIEVDSDYTPQWMVEGKWE